MSVLNRRHIRIKVLQTLYAFSQHEDKDILWAEKELFRGIEQMYDLYISLLLLFPELKNKAEHRIAENKKKMIPAEEDIEPNLKFVDNEIIKIIEESIVLRTISEQRKVNWVGDEKQELIRKMFNYIRQSETYFEFMNNGKSGFEEDMAFMTQLFKTEIANFQLLYDFFEDESVYWLDDIDLTCSMVLKTIKKFEPLETETGSEPINVILPLYKSDETAGDDEERNERNNEEKEYMVKLLKETIKSRSENLKLIAGLTKNWELDRIAKMDVLLMELAITELTTFNNIPTKVTLNEFIEISKYYSTPKSNGFINGILDKAIVKLEKEGKIKKIGRGLMK